MQSSNFDNIGIKPSLLTDKTGEFSFCKDTKKKKLDAASIQNINILSPDSAFMVSIFLLAKSLLLKMHLFHFQFRLE